MKEIIQRVFAAGHAYKQVVKDKAGSPTVEYVILIGVGALVAGLLALALSKDNNEGIVKSISGKISQIIQIATTPVKDSTGK